MDVIGTSSEGSKLPHRLCQFQGFFHMLTGIQIYEYNFIGNLRSFLN